MRSNLLNITVTLGLLAGVFALFQFTDLDVWLQDHLYDFDKQRWILDKQDDLSRILFYTGPKVALGIAGGLPFVWLLLPKRWRPKPLKNFELPWPPRRVWLVLLSLIIVPATVGFMKSRSDLYCPWSVDRYGGDRPHLHFFDPLPPGYPPACGNCFPAGHASGGFALLGLYYLSETRRGRWLGLTFGMIAGWAMGIYQMLKGAHFLSHTVVTMLVAVLIIQLLAWLLKVEPVKASPTPGP